MAAPYNHREVEQKWQKIWDDEQAFKVSEDYSKPKYYALVEFPYPSGAGLHVGHPRPYTAMDIVSRKRRMQGYNVLYPMGWDAFGLPTENYAIKNHIHPRIVTKNNVARFKEQLHALGYSFDWDREVNTTDEEYYKWTQWIFLKLFKAGLATVALFNVVGRWNDWFTGMLYVENPNLIPLQTLLTKLQNSVEYLKKNSAVLNTPDGLQLARSAPSISLRMACTVAVILPMLFAYPFFQRFFVNGLTVGSIKE